MRTLRQIPKVVGQTDAGETIYEARSARLVLRGDAAHFNRLVRCSKCGREVPGRAVLGPADLDHPAQAVMCNDCVEAATAMAARPRPPAEAVAVDEPALADAQAEMNVEPEVQGDELAEPEDDEAEDPDVAESEAEDEEYADEQDEAPAEEEPPAVNLQLLDDVAGLDDELPAPEEDEALMAGVALDELEAPAPDDDEALDESELPRPWDEEPAVANDGPDEDEPPAGDEPAVAGAEVDEEELPAGDEPVVAGEELDEDEPPAPARLDADPQEDDLARRIDVLEGRLLGAATEDPRFAGLELRIVEMINRLIARTEAQAERQDALEARIDNLGAGAAAQGKKDGDKVRRQLHQMGERLEQLQAGIDAEWVRAKSETATLAQTIADLGERVLRLAEQAGDTAGAEVERLEAVEARVDEMATRLSKALDAQRKELQDGLQKGLADVLAAVPPASAPAENVDGRLRAMEKQVRQGQAEVSELNELHAALDAGLGELRAELGDVRTGMGRLADSKADLDDRLETFVRMSLVPEGDKGRKAKRSAESTLGTLSAAVQDLIREQRQLKDSVATIEQASDAATAAAARASMQASSLGPIRSDVKLLHQEIAEQQEALDALRRTVERLRQPPPSAPPAAAPARKAAPAQKAAPATKAVPVKKAAPAPAAKAPAKRAAAKAAIARAAATQAAAAKAPAAKRAPRAKKA